jgi:hypothetical protein
MPAIASEPASAASVDLRAIRVEDLVPYSPEEEVRAEQDIISGMGAVEPVATATRSKTFHRRGWAIGILSFFAGIGIIFLVSGAYYSWGSNPGGIPPGKKPSFPGSSGAATAPLKPAFDVQSLESHILQKAVAGNLFVITGTVKNVGKAPSRGIRVRATLFGKDNQVLIKQASIAGNYLDKFALPHMVRTTIEGHLTAARYEEGSGNHNVLPGNSVPFTVVCFEPPSKVESFEVLATDAEL